MSVTIHGCSTLLTTEQILVERINHAAHGQSIDFTMWSKQ